MNRRSAVKITAGALITALGGARVAGAPAGWIVETRYGRLRGAADGRSIGFKGIRYAVAERFMPPRPPASWGGVRDAVAYGAIAPQANPDPPPGPPAVILAQIPRPAGAPPPARPEESEDCLFLNVWTSGLRDGRRRPVLVWLHGGFFAAGSGATGDGSALAARGDVVVVSLNHRLNAFGYCHLAELGGTDFAHAGNLGMLDIAAALEWVRDNIEAFGGDPARVTLVGESGGGMKASFLMACPRAAGLFHRAAIQSGPGLRFMTRDAAARATDMLLAELGLTAASWSELRTMPVARLLAGYHRVAAKLRPRRFIDLACFAPVIDPVLLPRQPFSPAAHARPVPLLIGWNAQEMSFFMGADAGGFALDEAGLRGRLAGFLGDHAEAADALYRRLYPDAAPSRRYIQAFSDYSLMLPTLAQAERATAAGFPVHLYRFDRQSPALGGELGAFHTSEAPYLFDLTDRSAAVTGGGPEARALARRMGGAWAAFAATGDPAGVDLPAWPRYALSTRSTMLLDDRCAVAADPTRAERALLAPLLAA